MNLEFNAQQEQVASLFTAYRNDIDIYTEDEDKDKLFYKELFSRLLEGTGIQINDVYPLGSSKDVINACKNDSDTTRRKIYIVDGDIYLMYNPKVKIPNLFVLDAYCMENLVIDEDSVCHALCHLYAKKELNEIKAIFQFEKLLEQHKDVLIELFYHYALASKYLGFFTLGSFNKFFDNRHNCIRLEMVETVQNEIKTKVLSESGISEGKFFDELADLERIFPKTSTIFLQIVSGKDYLIPMISNNAFKIFDLGFKYPKEVWKYNMCSYCDLSRLQGLKQEIINKCILP